MKKYIPLFFFCLLAGGGSYGQITLSEKNVPLKVILREIKKQADYDYLCLEEHLNLAGLVTIRVNNKPVNTVLETCLKNKPLTYDIKNKTIFINPTSLPPANGGITAPISQLINITGRVVNEKDEPVAGATIQLKSTRFLTATDHDGYFYLHQINKDAVLAASFVGHDSAEVSVNGKNVLLIRLKIKVTELTAITVPTGYQYIYKEKSTGSHAHISNSHFKRRVSTSVHNSLAGSVSGVLYTPPQGNQPFQLTIRGFSTFIANQKPLIIVDNFPFEDDLNLLNPNDIESITFLKDAAAASIWGVRAGNGVMVINLEKPKQDQQFSTKLTTNITFGAGPNLYYQPVLPVAGIIDLQKKLFSDGFYLLQEADPRKPVLPPAVEILIKEREQLITPEEAALQLNTLLNRDARKDLEKYFYKTSISRQYHLNVGGRLNGYNYYFSLGYDKNPGNLINSWYNRKTLFTHHTVKPVKNLEIKAAAMYSESRSVNNDGMPLYGFLYNKLVDDNGLALAVPSGYRDAFKESAHGQGLLNWHNRPYDEVRSRNDSTIRDMLRLDLNLNYKITPELEAKILFQHNKSESRQNNRQGIESYHTRDYINRFSQAVQQGIYSPVPYGGINDFSNYLQRATNLRVQLSYTKSWGENRDHDITLLGGYERRTLRADSTSGREYGLNRYWLNPVQVDYNTLFPLYVSPFLSEKLIHNNSASWIIDNNRSFYVNAIYTIRNKYTFTASARKDQSNIFGNPANKKTWPLGSAGFLWHIDKETFYYFGLVPNLKLRISYGSSGNVDKTASAFTTASINSSNIYGAPAATVNNSPNPGLRWERINQFNIGTDLATAGKKIQVSFDYYIKKGKDLFGAIPVDQTTGTRTFTGNIAGMKGHGADVSIQTRHGNRNILYQSLVLFSYAKNKVTGYENPPIPVWYYTDPEYFIPREGYPLFSLNSVRWAGLDNLTGNPQGIVNGKPSQDYSYLLQHTNPSELINNGPRFPVISWSLLQEISINKINVSFTITGKHKYVFRRSSVDYGDLLYNNGTGHIDYLQRWQKPGDEMLTTVPSLSANYTPDRDLFYKYAEVLVEKGDHIRLQDVRISYDFIEPSRTRHSFKQVQLYIFVNNPGILWRKNKRGIDPDYVTGFPMPRSISAGLKIEFN